MVKQSLWGYFRKRTDGLVDVETHRRPSVSESSRELHRDDALLMPEGGAAVPKQVRVETFGATHGVAESGALDSAEGLQMGNDIGLHGYPPASTRLGRFRPDPDAQSPYVDVSMGHRYRLANPHSRVFKENASQSVARVERGKQGQEVVCVRGLWYEARRLREADGAMAGWVLGELVEDHTSLAYVAGNRSWTKPVSDHAADPADHVGGGE